MAPAGSTRWCPTPEQLMMLEEMYRGGIRTPSATQIQQITANLSLYGKIEGKNVFYWFQNHKARDRQKLRRKLMLIHQHHQQLLYKNYLHSPPNYALHQLSHNNTAGLLLGGVEAASTKQMNYAWKVDLPERLETGHKSMDRTCGRDWMMMMSMMDVGPTISCCKKPLETLELFPIKTTNLKDQCSGQ
ncbi:hypothetical protein LguiA_012173 [Lonicera macranthoides]